MGLTPQRDGANMSKTVAEVLVGVLQQIGVADL